MKRIVISLLMATSCNLLEAQNVGIGMANPAYRLDLTGDIRINDGVLRLFSTADNNSWEIRRSLSTNRLSITEGNTVRAVIVSGGNMGIGTDLPSEKLHVIGNIRNTGRIDADGVIEGNGISSTGTLFVNQTSLLQGAVTGFSSAQFTGNIGSNTGMTINNSSAILQLQSGGNNKGFVQLSGDNFRFGTNSGNNNGNVVLRMGGTDMIEFRKTGSGGTFVQMNLNGTSTGVLQTTSTGNVSLTAVNANAQVQLGGEVFINNTANRTGIGTSSPTERLHVNGNVVVNGNAVIDDGRITATATGSAYNLLPVCYGRVNENGTKAGGTQNFTVTRHSVGSYDITCAAITPSSIIFVNCIGGSGISLGWFSGNGYYRSGNTMTVVTAEFFNTESKDCAFHFIIYNP